MNVNTIITGDSAEVLKTFDAESIDLTVTSPPYDNLRDYEGFVLDYQAIIEQLYRVTKVGGVVVWVVGDAVIDGSESGTSFRQALYFQQCGFNIHDTMIYEKNGSALPDNTRYLQCFEYMFVFSKGRPSTINFLEDRKNRYTERWGKGQTVREKDGSMTERAHRIGKELGRRFNIWRINNGYGYSASDDMAYDHPAIFPEALARDHILSWSNVGDLVLDPFCGSGTTCKMAKMNSRNYIGIEISPEYVSLAEKRILATSVPLFV